MPQALSAVGSSPLNGNRNSNLIPQLNNCIIAVERELVNNNLVKAEATAKYAVESFLEDPNQFRQVAATASTPKIVQTILPFWRLVTLQVQCRLLIDQGHDESADDHYDGNSTSSGLSSLLSSPSSHFGQQANNGGAASGTTAAAANNGNGFSSSNPNGGSNGHSHHASGGAALHNTNPSSGHAFGGNGNTTLTSTNNNNSSQNLVMYLPEIFERLERIRKHSVPPAARILHTQVLRSMGDLSAALDFMERYALANALESDAFVSDAEDAAEEGHLRSPTSEKPSTPTTPSSTSSAAGQDPQQRQALNGLHHNGTGTPKSSPVRSKRRPKNGSSASTNGGSSNGEDRAYNGTPALRPNGGTPSNSKAPQFPTASPVKTSGGGGNKKKRQALRMLSWTPSLILSAVELFISLCFEEASSALNEHTAADDVTSRLQRAEERCIDFISSHSVALSSRLRACFSSTMDAPSVHDELLSRVELQHETRLQHWNRQCMSFAKNPTLDSDTPPLHYRTPTGEALSDSEMGLSGSHGRVSPADGDELHGSGINGVGGGSGGGTNVVHHLKKWLSPTHTLKQLLFLVRRLLATVVARRGLVALLAGGGALLLALVLFLPVAAKRLSGALPATKMMKKPPAKRLTF